VPLKVDMAKVAPAAPPADSTELVAVFAPDPSAHDGRFANNAWLQELPRPFTKMTWDNALLLGPATAKRLGVETGDIVAAKAAGRSVRAPVWVLAAHAEGAITLPLGYGRTAAGRVGNRVGFDAGALRPAGGAWVAPIAIERLGSRHDFAVTQHAIEQEGRKLARTVAPGGRIADPQFAHETLYPNPRPAEHAWGMTIDLDACIGCNACTIACQAENNIPVVGKEQVAHGREMHWIRVDRYETPEVEGSLFEPVPCMHCENAPCELVCPVGATMHDVEGLNVQVYNRCIGTRFCSNNCPYKVRRFNFLQFTDNETETLKAQRNPDVTVRRRGVMEKCTYCLQRIARARQESQATGRPLADGDVVTACQAVCPTSAIVFGDLNDPASALVRSRQSPRHYAMLGELNTRPRTTYLARVVPRKPEGA
jgi:molybdopterin-containing oxidoreductase family iron-sulfur binding subunit